MPFKHVKRVKNFCFVTFFDEADSVKVVSMQKIQLGKRVIIPDFTTDFMREKYQKQLEQANQKS